MCIRDSNAAAARDIEITMSYSGVIDENVCVVQKATVEQSVNYVNGINDRSERRNYLWSYTV